MAATSVDEFWHCFREFCDDEINNWHRHKGQFVKYQPIWVEKFSLRSHCVWHVISLNCWSVMLNWWSYSLLHDTSQPCNVFPPCNFKYFLVSFVVHTYISVSFSISSKGSDNVCPSHRLRYQVIFVMIYFQCFSVSSFLYWDGRIAVSGSLWGYRQLCSLVRWGALSVMAKLVAGMGPCRSNRLHQDSCSVLIKWTGISRKM